MDNYLKDPKVIVGILSIINAVWIALVFQWWRNRKGLSCKIVSDTPLFSVRPEVEHRVQLLLDGKPVENAHLVIMKVVNTGRVPIEDKDFITPVSVRFDAESTILNARITALEPPDLPAKTLVEKQCVTVEPLVLNQGDAITIQILVSKPNDGILIGGRVKGIRRLKKYGVSDSSRDRLGIYLGGLLVGWFVILPLTQFIVESDSLTFLGSLRYIVYAVLVILAIFAPLHFISKKAEKELEKRK